MNGFYQHCGEHHFQRYLAEFEFRYNTRQANDIDGLGRATASMCGIAGKSPTYEAPDASKSEMKFLTFAVDATDILLSSWFLTYR